MIIDECDTEHVFESVMRGVCYCRHCRKVFINPRLFRTGEVFFAPMCGEDWEAHQVAEAILDAWWPHLADKETDTVDNATQLPGMVGDRPQVPGCPGFELFARMP